MSTASQVNNFQISWVVARNAATADVFLAFAERLPKIRAANATDVQITLAGSPLGIQLSGSPSAVRADFEALEDRRFISGTIYATYALSTSARATITFNFPLVNIAVSIPNVKPSEADALFSEIREWFPAGRGPQQTELEARATKLTKLLQEADRLVAAASILTERKREVDELLAIVQADSAKAAEHLAIIQNLSSSSEEQKEYVETDREETSRLVAEIRNIKEETIADRDTVRSSRATATSLEVSIREFYDTIDSHKDALSDLVGGAEQSLKKNTEATTALITNNGALQVQIKEQLLKAAGGALFGAFEERKRQVIRSKVGWAFAAGLFSILQAVVVFYLAHEARTLAAAMVDRSNPWAFAANPLFILKATAALPILALIVFCIRQYAHERRVEETYAFKSTLSFSLAPYLDLVDRLTREGEKSAAHAEFAIRTIGQIFEDILSDSPKQPAANPSKEMIENVKQLLEVVTKLKN